MSRVRYARKILAEPIRGHLSSLFVDPFATTVPTCKQTAADSQTKQTRNATRNEDIFQQLFQPNAVGKSPGGNSICRTIRLAETAELQALGFCR